jgi:hypothetical protein
MGACARGFQAGWRGLTGHHGTTGFQSNSQEVSEAISDASPRSRSATRPSCAGTSAPGKQRARGMPGARCTRSRACSVESTRVSHHGRTGITRHSRTRMVLTVSFGLSPGTGLFCPRHLQITTCKLDASVGASGPHDFAVRLRAARLQRQSVHRIPHPTFVTIAKRPSCGNGTACL